MIITSQSRFLLGCGLDLYAGGWEGVGRDVLLFEGLLEEPDDDGQVAAFVVGGEQDGVFVADCHVGRRYCIIFWL